MPAIAASPARRHRVVMALTGLALSLLGAHGAIAAKGAARTFATAEEAAQALADAAKSANTKNVLAVLGAEAEPLIRSGDEVADENARERFVQSYDEAHSLVAGENGDMVLQVGKDDWPFPIPLVQTEAGWHFDAAAGKQEMLDRRIGANELAAIQACLAYVDAQREYYDLNPEGDPLLHYAAKLASTPGKRDGLYWETKADEPQSPLGEEFSRGRAEGYAMSGKGDPYHGYSFRILTAQGPAAAGGAWDYVVKGKMMGGFALVAYPAKWDNSGVMTFLVNQDGVVFQKDLGPDTAAKAKAMKTFNPDDTWKRVDESAAAAAKES